MVRAKGQRTALFLGRPSFGRAHSVSPSLCSRDHLHEVEWRGHLRLEADPGEGNGGGHWAKPLTQEIVLRPRTSRSRPRARMSKKAVTGCQTSGLRRLFEHERIVPAQALADFSPSGKALAANKGCVPVRWRPDSLFLVNCGYPVYSFFHLNSQFDNLERNVRRVISGAELQTWAANLIARHPPGDLDPRSDASFPPRLLEVAPRLGPHMIIYYSDDADHPPYVHLHWGSGFLGMHGFRIGPTNFVDYGGKSHEWQPGVYYIERQSASRFYRTSREWSDSEL